MDGLEIVELRLSEVLEGNDTQRIDSEFFNKKSLYFDKLLKTKKYFYLENVVSGPFGSTLKSHSYLDKGVAFVRVENLKDKFIIKKDTLVYISDENNLLLKNSQLFLNDLVMSKVGNTIGLIARVDEEIGTCNISENNLGIKLLNFIDSEKFYILVYLNSLYSQNLILRRISGNAQPKLNVGDMKKIPIPVVSNSFQLKIQELVKLSQNKIEQSKKFYSEAENLLLTELDLLNFKPSNENIAIKSFSESFEVSGRLDSEYYQPKYDEIIDKVKSTKYDILDNVVNIQKSIEPGSDAYQESGIPFVRVSNITKFGLSSPDIHLSKTLFDDEVLEKLQPKKDTILLSKDGTVGIAYNVKKNTNFITSGALLHLTIKSKYKEKIFSEYLTLILNSLVVQMQSQRDAGGSIIKHWKPSEIGEVLIPIIDSKTQTQIEEKIKKSFKLKEESRQLLELAKKAVEMAIEQDETQAKKLINEQI
ncbi:restriction endonuclease subunit S domain-containing protein [Bathymodiolus septemdierum thioautotrophic gill symbiont]|uniref:restriction endonuclease subunit S n=1 Tax=Bathymodiolus septemdierum thioautotrophic gill symbiont TaxID=113267 RepID=UPI000A6F3BA9|nr:restriction endonuclease subunit S [Bathymodiolus septemdierum thioautotrophic gill symbiont]